LLAELFRRHHLRLLGLEIYARYEDSYYARLRYRSVVTTYTMEVRPSDGMALATRLGAPILVADQLLADATRTEDGNVVPGYPDADVLYLGREHQLPVM
jgi:bifunctional DNase/RNase